MAIVRETGDETRALDADGTATARERRGRAPPERSGAAPSGAADGR